MAEKISAVLKKYISDKIPQKATNIFWLMFNGIEAMFTTLEYRLDITKRERNFLTAQHMSSLRHLSAINGFEPTLKIPSKGLLRIKVNPKLFNRVGYPLFLPPYSIFKNKISKLEYYYNSDKSLRIANNELFVPVIEGQIKSVQFTGNGKYIDRFYIADDNLANESIIISSGGVEYQQVKSFFSTSGQNDDKLYLIKFSNDIQNPIIVYIKGLPFNQKVDITYRLTSGEIGNLETTQGFSTESIIDSFGSYVDLSDSDMEITNYNGFDFGSNGTDENGLRAAIGYNHGNTLLFDNISYRNFLSKYSTILIQNVAIVDQKKSINNIYISKKQSINTDVDNLVNLINQYQLILQTKSYQFNVQEKTNLSAVLDEYEFCLSSNNIFDSITNNFAFQILFETKQEADTYSDDIKKLLYTEFGIFLNRANHTLNIEQKFEELMKMLNITFEYIIFNQKIEEEKIKNKSEIYTPYIIKNSEYMPLLAGDFDISDSEENLVKLFFDINIISKT